MRELREFRVHHEEYLRAGLPVAGISLDVPALPGMETDLINVFVWDD